MSIVEIPVIVEYMRSEDGTIISLKIRPTSIDPYKIESVYSGGIVTVNDKIVSISYLVMSSGKSFPIGVSYEAICAWMNTWCVPMPSVVLHVSADEYISAFSNENEENNDNDGLSDSLW